MLNGDVVQVAVYSSGRRVFEIPRKHNILYVMTDCSCLFSKDHVLKSKKPTIIETKN